MKNGAHALGVPQLSSIKEWFHDCPFCSVPYVDKDFLSMHVSTNGQKKHPKDHQKENSGSILHLLPLPWGYQYLFTL
jgi:hypothetical protein